MKFIPDKFLKIFTLSSSLTLTACAAYDLGRDGTTYYKITDPENATWEEVSFIVKNKCATCHTDEKPWYKPGNTPEKPNSEIPNFGLNKIGLQEFFNEKNELLSAVKACIESEDSKCGVEQIPMPPNYATPLNDNERKALLSFVQRFLDEKAKNDSTNLSQSFQSKCSTCHGSKGQGLGYPKIAGTSLSIEEFKNIIQNGRGGMPAISSYDISFAEADLAKLKKLP